MHANNHWARNRARPSVWCPSRWPVTSHVVRPPVRPLPMRTYASQAFYVAHVPRVSLGWPVFAGQLGVNLSADVSGQATSAPAESNPIGANPIGLDWSRQRRAESASATRKGPASQPAGKPAGRPKGSERNLMTQSKSEFFPCFFSRFCAASSRQAARPAPNPRPGPEAPLFAPDSAAADCCCLGDNFD